MCREFKEVWKSRNVLPHVLGWCTSLLKDLCQHVKLRASLKQGRAMKEFTEDTACAPNVHTLPVELCSIEQLWSTVPSMRRTQESRPQDTSPQKMEAVCRRSALSTLFKSVLCRSTVHDFGHTFHHAHQNAKNKSQNQTPETPW